MHRPTGKVINRGLGYGRIRSNAEEQRFALAWDAINRAPNELGVRTLDYLLAADGVHCKEPTKDERELAATIIQWLGSPIGQSFLSDVGYAKVGGYRKKIAIVMTETEALEYGMITCTCGHPVNNHFNHRAENPCARCDCTQYRPTARVGKLIT
jgi:hypothetical protein